MDAYPWIPILFLRWEGAKESPIMQPYRSYRPMTKFTFSVSKGGVLQNLEQQNQYKGDEGCFDDTFVERL